jgi:hypothetical protein
MCDAMQGPMALELLFGGHTGGQRFVVVISVTLLIVRSLAKVAILFPLCSGKINTLHSLTDDIEGCEVLVLAALRENGVARFAMEEG